MTSKVETSGPSSADPSAGGSPRPAPGRLIGRIETSAGVIPTSQVVILKEQDLDCDLATAIRRVRSAAETSRARILVVAPEDAEAPDAVSPPSHDLPVPPAPTTLSQVARRAEQAASVRFGARLEPLVACFDRFLEEARWALAELRRDSAGEGGRVLGEVLEWTQAVADDLKIETQLASAGFQPVDTRDLVVEMGRQIEAHFPGVRVGIAPAQTTAACWGRPAELAEGFFLALVLAAHRIGGHGPVSVEIVENDGDVEHRFVGHGEPVEVHAPHAVARLRDIVRRHDGRLAHDGFGVQGTGLTLHLPRV